MLNGLNSLRLINNNRNLFNNRTVEVNNRELLRYHLDYKLLNHMLINNKLNNIMLINNKLNNNDLLDRNMLINSMLNNNMDIYELLLNDLLNHLFQDLLVLGQTTRYINNRPMLYRNFTNALVTRFNSPALRTKVAAQVRNSIYTRFQVLMNSFYRRGQIHIQVLCNDSHDVVVGRKVASLYSLNCTRHVIHDIYDITSSVTPVSSPSSDLGTLGT